MAMPEEVVDDGFRINARRVDPDAVLIDIAGDIDLQTAPGATAFLTEATATSPRHLILDLSAVTFLASAGINLLIAAQSGGGDPRRTSSAGRHRQPAGPTASGIGRPARQVRHRPGPAHPARQTGQHRTPGRLNRRRLDGSVVPAGGRRVRPTSVPAHAWSRRDAAPRSVTQSVDDR